LKINYRACLQLVLYLDLDKIVFWLVWEKNMEEIAKHPTFSMSLLFHYASIVQAFNHVNHRVYNKSQIYLTINKKSEKRNRTFSNMHVFSTGVASRQVSIWRTYSLKVTFMGETNEPWKQKKSSNSPNLRAFWVAKSHILALWKFSKNRFPSQTEKVSPMDIKNIRSTCTDSDNNF